MSVTASRAGLAWDGNPSDTASMFYEGFANEVILAFNKNVKLMDKIRIRNLPKGVYTATFPVIGNSTVKFHTPGDDLLADSGYSFQFSQAERTIYADKRATATVLVDGLDEKLSSFDARMEYAKQLGGDLVAAVEKNVMYAIGVGSAASAVYTGASVGVVVTDATALTQANAFINDVMDLQKGFDSNGVPDQDRYLVISPTVKALLLKGGTNNSYWHLDTDYGNVGNGSLANGVVGRIGGFQVISHNNFPTNNNSDTTHKISPSAGNSYTYNATGCAALAFQKDCVGAARAMDLTLDVNYAPRFLAHQVTAYMSMGIAAIRPEGCGAIKTA